MGVDASIIGGLRPVQLENPVNSLAKILQVQGMQQQGELHRQQADEYRTGVERKNKLYGLMGQEYAKPEDRESALLKGGFGDEAMKFGKDRRDNLKADADRQKVELESHLKRFEVAGQIMSGVSDQTSWDMARQRTAQVFGAEAAQQMPAQYDPALVEQKRQQAMSVKEQIEAKYKALTFEESKRHNLRTEGHSAATLAETRRHSGVMEGHRATEVAAPKGVLDPERGLLVDPRTGVGRPITVDGAPVGAKEKPLNEGQAGALQFGARMTAAEDIFGELAGKGVNASTPGSRSGFGVGEIVNAMQPADNQRLDQAKRDFINASLRRESGASISPTEFDNAEKQYFPQIGETDPTVLAQKKRNRELQTRGMLATVPNSAAHVAKVRQAPGAPAPAKITNDEQYAALKSGTEFVGPDGVTRRKP
jgi:hypothetical protein